MGRPIKLKNRRKVDKSPSGCFGTYVQLSRTQGVKILAIDGEQGCRTIRECKASSEYHDAKGEVELLKAAAKSGCVPKVYGIRPVLVNGEYFPGIVMQHLGHKTLGDLKMPESKRDKILTELRESLIDVGVKHNDLHKWNAMRFRGKYYAIDFTPGYVSLTETEGSEHE